MKLQSFLYSAALMVAASASYATDPMSPAIIVPTASTFVEKPITPELIKAIRKGGFVLYMRHGSTDNKTTDRLPDVDLNDCSTQRTLSDEGRAEMKAIGVGIYNARIPLGEIYVSPMCRTKESAKLAIGDHFKISESLMYSANMTSEQKKPRLEGLKKLITAPVAAGTNRLLIAHAPNLDDLIGFFVKPPGTVVVFQLTASGGYEYLASIHPQDWPELKK